MIRSFLSIFKSFIVDYELLASKNRWAQNNIITSSTKFNFTYNPKELRLIFANITF